MKRTGWTLAVLVIVFSITFRSFAATSVEAVRTAIPPVIDGKLVDNCWQKAKPVTDFRAMGSKAPAQFQSVGFILYDDGNLYMGVKLLEPDISSISTEVRQTEGLVFRDDSIEIMIDPGYSKTNYIQLAVNASGSRFDCLRTLAGARLDHAWNGDWEAASFIGDSYWSCEVKVPFYTLGVTAKSGSTWGINICRNKQKTGGYSSIADLGAYNEPVRFPQLKVMEADFSKYSCRLGEPRWLPDIKDDRPQSLLTIPIKNESVIERQVLVEGFREIEGKISSFNLEPMALKPGEERLVLLEPVTVKHVGDNDAGLWVLSAPQATRKVLIRDAGSNIIIAGRNIGVPDFIRPLRLQAIGSGNSQEDLRLEVASDLSAASLQSHRLQVLIETPGREKLFEKVITSPSPVSTVPLPRGKLPSGELVARAFIQNRDGTSLCEATIEFVNVRGKLKKLNSLVTELLNTRCSLGKGKTVEYRFENPRRGWIFVGTNAILPKDQRLSLSINSTTVEPSYIATEAAGGETLEVMHFLSAGEHRLSLHSDAPASVSLVVRAVPEMVFTKFQYDPHITSYGPYDWNYLSRYVLRNVNCIIGSGDPPERPLAGQWKKQGRKWISETYFHGLFTPTEPITAESAYQYWVENPGFTDPNMDGIIADEITRGNPKGHVEAWGNAIRMLSENEKFKGKAVYGYAGGSIVDDEHGKKFVETVIKSGGKMSLERYVYERPTEEETRTAIDAALKQDLLAWEKVIPGCRQHMIFALGYFVSVTACSLNLNPATDWKALMDMEFYLLANDPVFSGLYGIQEYTSGYADDETMRWASRLYRHYCIEGNTETLSTRYGFKYVLDHIQNPDFNDGTQGWDIKAAEPGSVGAKNFPGYGQFQGRFPAGAAGGGDDFIWTRRSDKGPNIVRQEIKNLIPGNLYSMKLVTGDFGELKDGKSDQKKHPVSININNVAVMQDKSFVEVRPSHSSVELGPFNKNNRFCFNYHWKVFRSNGTSATLEISDWQDEHKPGGPIGQELMYNFVEVQPYFSD